MQPKIPGLPIEKLHSFLRSKGYDKQSQFCTPDSEFWATKDLIYTVRFNTNMNPIPFEFVLDIFKGQLNFSVREIPFYRAYIDNNFRPDGSY